MTTLEEMRLDTLLVFMFFVLIGVSASILSVVYGTQKVSDLSIVIYMTPKGNVR